MERAIEKRSQGPIDKTKTANRLRATSCAIAKLVERKLYEEQ